MSDLTRPAIFFEHYLNELTGIFKGLNSSEFEQFIDELLSAYQREAFIFVFGNGGSGATASHFASDINKGVSYGLTRRFRVVCLNDNTPTISAYANDVSFDDVFVEQLANFLTPNDLVIGISGSGNSANVLKAVEYANRLGSSTFGICGYGGGRLKELATGSLVINSNDMQKVEDLHFVALHCAMKYLVEKLHKNGLQ